MPSKEQLDNMASQLGLGYEFSRIIGIDNRTTVMHLTIAAMQAKALADIAYIYGFNNGKL